MKLLIARLLSEEGFAVFFLVTVVLGGGAAWLTGRALAATWRPWWQVPVYTLLLAGAVRFIHKTLFGAPLLSLHDYALDALVCLTIGMAAYRFTRARQMCTQYAWLNVRRGLFDWAVQGRDTNRRAPESG